MSDKVTIDQAGRLVLPKRVRDELHLSAGDVLEVTVEDDEVTLRPRRAATPLEKERGIWVLRTGEPLTTADVEEVIQKVRARRREQNAGENR